MGASGSSRSGRGAGRHVALLRGINVGGKNRVAMKDLTTAFVEAGCDEVRTYIQSGNVVFSASRSVADRVQETVSGTIRARFGLEVPVVTRSAAQFEAVVERVPWTEDTEQGIVHVMFMRDAPSPKAVAALEPDRSPGDSFWVEGRELYLRLPGGVARTKLTNAYFDAALGTICTARNWRTVLKLQEMLAVDS